MNHGYVVGTSTTLGILLSSPTSPGNPVSLAKLTFFGTWVSLREQCTQPAWPTDKTSPGENKKGDTKKKKKKNNKKDFSVGWCCSGCGCSGQPGWTVAREPPRGRQGAGG
ncbi:hypothetical protein CEXT_459711 [Caerostris extrusa]|uniref:Secreted protein n=1 Tax=Caerostris extrusa TaxID=172846 RepID=A0AAV4QWQ7_CAEEX|nr:hypothetical protein CEXT_459711 [Caerostris extrusa]